MWKQKRKKKREVDVQESEEEDHQISSTSNFDQITKPLMKSDEVIEEKVEITETVIEAEKTFCWRNWKISDFSILKIVISRFSVILTAVWPSG